MQLGVINETLTNPEKHSWLASKHGTDAAAPAPGLLDGAAFGAVYTDGFAKSGTIVAKNSVTGRIVPFDNAGSNGTNTAIGILYTTIDLRNGSGGFINSPAAVLYHGQVITSKLPRTSAQTGGPHANAVTALKNFTFR